MSMKKDRKGLGRGLSALMADIDHDTKIISNTVSNTSSNMLPIEKVIANPNQPRQDFNKEDLEDLTRSIASRGIIQPIIVRVSKENNDLYQIVAGERRWRAAQKAQLHEVPVVVRDFTDEELLEVAIIENVQRSNLNPVEEALAYKEPFISLSIDTAARFSHQPVQRLFKAGHLLFTLSAFHVSALFNQSL